MHVRSTNLSSMSNTVPVLTECTNTVPKLVLHVHVRSILRLLLYFADVAMYWAHTVVPHPLKSLIELLFRSPIETPKSSSVGDTKLSRRRLLLELGGSLPIPPARRHRYHPSHLSVFLMSGNGGSSSASMQRRFPLVMCDDCKFRRVVHYVSKTDEYFMQHFYRCPNHKPKKGGCDNWKWEDEYYEFLQSTGQLDGGDASSSAGTKERSKKSNEMQ